MSCWKQLAQSLAVFLPEWQVCDSRMVRARREWGGGAPRLGRRAKKSVVWEFLPIGVG